MESKIICFGDMHLGRRPSRLPSDLDDHGVNVSDLTPGATLTQGVDWAIEQQADAIVFIGDVVEHEEERFEAYNVLIREIKRLFAEKIQVVAVAGNHDSSALPRLAKQIPQVRLLGEKGQWELIHITTRTHQKIGFLGWSFPDRYYRDNPLTLFKDHDFKALQNRAFPVIGLLHCDLEAHKSPYAPVGKTELMEMPVDAWLLGHSHKKDEFFDQPPLGYLGSILGLDPGESGAHGPWEMTVHDSGKIRMTHLPLAGLRWEQEDLDAQKIQGDNRADLEDSLHSQMLMAIDRIHQRIHNPLGALKAVGCRLFIQGPTPLHREIRNLLQGMVTPSIHKDGVHYFVEKVMDSSRLALDINLLARGDDPPGLLARRLMALENLDETGSALIQEATLKLEETSMGAPWARLEKQPLDVRDLLLQTGYEALEELLAQADQGGTG